ncbi:GPI ethanolamine phosphate transferase 1-like [Ruditapes philippinarum]|uniref:GPI ethanolamine phosphate transferase 1-like n=1 Tax=Ruditapes philippinarum TaxID=129788 RepID=UPI00295BFAAD|nr:GPI ethanolamine phosphate transferase 1-like [Ruditapes philippinarum]XP_060585516.1 GPI ethanolamine phosphate transferase 1-like [Ruditapes philippinarum]XP_060585517.1 GPI ethanolamine phosphate transferase 1-like [Ruditapes philippinarum]
MQTWELMTVGLLIHTVFFYSIFDIYFTSPIVHGMTPHSSPTTPPAKRLVLFSTDGLRADKMFELDENGETRTPFLRSVIEETGAWGVSHTRVPTESRPGHVALIAGFYEDVSAVAKGWKENPVEFDSVFNETTNTWSWGSPDILPMFAKGASGGHVFTKCYPAEFEDFSGSYHTKLDTWVFEEVKQFFKDSGSDDELRKKLQQDKIVFFLHLLGIDTSGHSSKPYSRAYLDNIRLVDAGIKEVVEVIEKFYNNDGHTAYIMSSDHGMTDWGSHGAGHPSETLTPLVAWGAGIRKAVRDTSSNKFKDDFSREWKLDHLKRTDVEQADIAPLMAALIGINYPMNSVGILPHDFLDIPEGDLAEAIYANVRQLLEQYQVKMELKKSTTLSVAFRPFSDLTPTKLAETHRHIRQLIQNGHFRDAINECKRVMEIALKGMSYFQTYDRFFLGASIFSGFLGWMMYVLTLVFEKHSGVVRPRLKLEKQMQPTWRSDTTIYVTFGCLGLLITILLFVQSLPWTNYLYCLIPVVLWMLVALRCDILIQVYGYMRTMKNRTDFIVAVLASLVGLEILVVGFFYREMLTVGLLLIAMLPWVSGNSLRSKRQLCQWSLSCLVLSLFPLLPVVTGKRHLLYVKVGGASVLLVSLYHYFIKSKNSTYFTFTDKILYCFQIVCVSIATYFSGFIVSSGMSELQHAISWFILGCCMVQPLFSSTQISTRLHAVYLAFAAPFILLSVSYEILFFLALSILLYQWLQMECSQLPKSSNSSMIEIGRNLLDIFDFCKQNQYSTLTSRNYLVIGDIQRAFYFVFIILTGFFGTGNIASINSFDPSSVLCFVSVFSPFVMGALLLFKVVVPFVLVTCTLQAVHTITQVPFQGLLMIILLMSDCMAVHFFFLVQDYGSWLDIGTSISHYIIVMCMIIFTKLLYGVSHLLTCCQVTRSTSSKKE